MSTTFDLRNPGRPIHVGVVLLNTVTEHLDIAPIGFFHNFGKDFIENLPPFAISPELRSQALDFVTHWVTEDGKTPGSLSGNLKVIPTDSFTTCPPLDIVLIGAGQMGYQATTTEKAFLRKCYAECSAFLSVCGASDALLATDILEGKTATGPLSFLPLFRQMAPGTNWVEKRWVRDGKIWTTGTLLNGLDMIAAFGREVWGGEGSLVEHVLRTGYFPSRNVDYKDEVSEKSPRSQVVKAPTHHGNDVVSGLFQKRPKEEDDQVMQLRKLHRGLLQGHTVEEGDTCTPRDTTPNVGDAVDCELRSSRMNLNMNEAEELLLQFRQQRAYFPFIEVPEVTTAAAMAASQPFLLLAILTVSLTRKPLLQKRLDERFRRVLSERIIFYGEKSMDYVQGLLVYMAWRPLHIRPLSRQGSQFMQILVTMIIDLKLTENMHDKAARDVCVGCFSLSSLLSVGFRRRGDDGAYKYLKEAVDANKRLKQPYDEKFQLSELHVLFEEIIRCQFECSSMKCPITKKQRVEEKMESLRLELQIFERVHDVNSSMYINLSQPLCTDIPTVPLRLFILSLKVHIALLPFRILDPRSSNIPNHEHLFGQVTSCATEIRSFFEYFLSIPQDQYISFSIRDWCQLILTISASSHICFLSPAQMSPTWNDFRTRTRSSMLIYLESLSHRMSRLSVTKTGDTPDVFFMFKSVLDIVMSTYAPSSGESSSPMSMGSRGESSIGEDICRDVAAGPPTPSTRCPMVNGSIRESEFWEAMKQSDVFLEGLGNGNSQDMFTSGISGVDSLLGDCADWPSIFSEWVNVSTN
ncbi:Major Facilitator Superfamily protein [Aspergillus niger]|uniref:Major Facilitator Superfamily protein n=1 Tax=Aspergillus niger TaxID=5061 RepID=A0A505HV15_ASPNG|nr:Major Facilitator Superfamily protein [Aspergillus niger]